MKLKRRNIIMVGAFPPPIHGMSLINSRMSDLLRESADISVRDVSAGSLDRGFQYHVARVTRAIRSSMKILFGRFSAGTSMYMSLSGGMGLVYDILFALAARIRGIRLTVHHHSYAYISEHSYLAKMFFQACPDDTSHIALSDSMRRQLCARYGITSCRVLSNAAFLPPLASDHISKRKFQKLGFLSNIAKEKGIFDFIELLDACQQGQLRVEGYIAGPFQDTRTEIAVRALLAARPHITYIGPQYGAAKTEFFQSIDALIFPTRYSNEAEPVTIHEALMHGVPVIAYGRGSIPDILSGSLSHCVPPEQDFVSMAVPIIQDWIKLGLDFSPVRQDALRLFQSHFLQAEKSLKSLVDSI